MEAKLTPEQPVKTIDLKEAKELMLIVVDQDGQVETFGNTHLKQFFEYIESLNKYAEIGKAFVAHQKEGPCDFGYNDEDCQCADCCDTIKRLCELSAGVD
jgi:hypothetical protein